MLTVTVSDTEVYDDVTGSFKLTTGFVVSLEHSLISISKWEALWCKPFLGSEEKTQKESIDYIRCMVIDPPENVSKNFPYEIMSRSVVNDISSYIDAPMTATTIPKQVKKSNREIITSELIYYWMISCNIPFECQTWHLNRLLMLINVCAIKNAPPKKMGRGELLSRNRQLNSVRKDTLNTTG